ncbi:S-layer homology domain-containing protein [Flavonifractor plautii]|uniref:S-layer homology domain-containing protein n=1 Tax=Flavonifractor plautii TaxID=292800 RepID=UPI00189B8867|nr:S-layer homology domain-containing protein [Flavonifractor plautii]MDB7911453.1 S-layer homology domain-containing protein [Flavonifractor plautii]MDB7916904.1 S-layer homology domain-containing protein [Flavonifractor plautii]
MLNLLMVALCLGQMVTVASAKTPNESYVDVPCTSPYYEAVEYLTSMGVTSGVGAGRFAPDNIITFDEFIVMLMKTMQPEAVAAEYPSNHWNRQALWAAINAGVLEGPESMRYQENGITRMEAWHLICRASDFNPYPAWCYTQQTPVLDLDSDLKHAMVSTGLYDELPEVNQGMTRGETAALLYRIVTDDYTHQQVPELVVKTNMQMLSPTCWRMRNEAIYDLAVIPQKYVDEFQRLGWSIVVSTDMGAYEEKHPMAIGLTTSNQILLSTKLGDHFGGHTLIHEMGHFVARVTGTAVMLNNIIELEEDGLAKVTGSYCKTSKHEYFAEAFRYVSLNRGNAENYAKVVDNAPLTVKFIERAYLDADGLYSLDAVNAVSHEAFQILHM